MNTGKITDVTGTAIPLRGNDIDTDRIIPARFLRCVTFDGLGKHVFEDDRIQNKNHVFDDDRFVGSEILVAGRNFGCGSSREHAPQALAKWGIRAIVGISFAEIFFGNCISLGVPCLRVNESDLESLYVKIETEPTSKWTLDVASATISHGDITVQGEIPHPVREAFISGSWNVTQVLMEATPAIAAKAKELPYMNNFA